MKLSTFLDKLSGDESNKLIRLLEAKGLPVNAKGQERHIILKKHIIPKEDPEETLGGYVLHRVDIDYGGRPYKVLVELSWPQVREVMKEPLPSHDEELALLGIKEIFNQELLQVLLEEKRGYLLMLANSGVHYAIPAVMRQWNQYFIHHYSKHLNGYSDEKFLMGYYDKGVFLLFIPKALGNQLERLYQGMMDYQTDHGEDKIKILAMTELVSSGEERSAEERFEKYFRILQAMEHNAHQQRYDL